jgi:choline dehydrogenase
MSYDRRQLLGAAARIAAVGAGAGLVGGALLSRRGEGPAAPAAVGTQRLSRDPRQLADSYDYVVVGAGAGGGPVAVRLAEAGYRTLLLEAGPADVPEPAYSVPALHLQASAHPAMSWDFYVRHFSEANRHGRRWQSGPGGMLYPRASTVGGCTAHYAQLTMAAEDDDWREAVRVTGDDRWNPTAMSKHLRAVLGWLPVEQVPPTILLRDRTLARIVVAAAIEAGVPVPRPGHEIDLNSLRVAGLVPDPNDPAHVEAARDGLFLVPQSTKDGRRQGVREYVLDALARLGDRLVVQTDALVERIVFDRTDEGVRARAVSFRHGRHLYRASPQYRADETWTRHRVQVSREVVLAGGAFNSPQLLMLSGIGPADELRRHGVPVRLDLPAVGTTLQDRYEMSVVSRYSDRFGITDGLTFGAPGDPGMARWKADPLSSVYRSNGIVVGVKLAAADGRPDVFVFGSPSRFEGYEPGFAVKALTDPRYFTWAVLKGWSQNRTGTVRLRSADPTEPPDVNFRYFDDATGGDADLDGVLRGLRFARAVNRRADQLAWLDQARAVEVFPGPALADGTKGLRDHVRRDAWGHHAACSNPMGRSDDGRSVVDGQLLVHGTSNLRIVDASVFAQIPGMFPVVAIFMVAEKAAADMLALAAREPQ